MDKPAIISTGGRKKIPGEYNGPFSWTLLTLLLVWLIYVCTLVQVPADTLVDMNSLLIMLDITSVWVFVSEQIFTKKMWNGATRVVPCALCHWRHAERRRKLSSFAFAFVVVLLGVVTASHLPWMTILVIIAGGLLPHIIMQLLWKMWNEATRVVPWYPGTLGFVFAFTFVFVFAFLGVMAYSPLPWMTILVRIAVGLLPHIIMQLLLKTPLLKRKSFLILIISITFICNVVILGTVTDTPWLTILEKSGIRSGLLILLYIVYQLLLKIEDLIKELIEKKHKPEEKTRKTLLSLSSNSEMGIRLQSKMEKNDKVEDKQKKEEKNVPPIGRKCCDNENTQSTTPIPTPVATMNCMAGGISPIPSSQSPTSLPEIDSLEISSVEPTVIPATRKKNENIEIIEHSTENFLEGPVDLSISETSSLEPNDDIDDLYIFKSHIASLDEPLLLADVKITSNYSTEITMRCCPPDEYNNFSESVKLEEGLCISTPIIQIDDFERFLSNSCKELKIRHNVYEWQNFKICHLRAYRDLQDLNNYMDIEAQMCKDYITVCGHSNDGQTEERNDKRSSSDFTSRQQTEQNRSGNSSNDEGYTGRDESPTPTTYSLLHLSKAEDICDVRLYFTRLVKNNPCPLPHQITVFVVLDKELKINEFLEKELPECGMEQAAVRIRVAIFKDQTYTPILGECPKINPKNIWDEAHPFGIFSYDLLNQKKGFFRIEKTNPPLMISCDERRYLRMKLTLLAKGNPPLDHIYGLGAEIAPITCNKFCATEYLPTDSPLYPNSGSISNPANAMSMVAVSASDFSSFPNTTSSIPASTSLSNTVNTTSMMAGLTPSASSFPISTTSLPASYSLNTVDTMSMVAGDIQGFSPFSVTTKNPPASGSISNPADTMSMAAGFAPSVPSFPIPITSLPASASLSNTCNTMSTVPDDVPRFSICPILTTSPPTSGSLSNPVNTIWTVDQSSIQRKLAKGSLRRCRAQIEQGSGGFKCPYCSKKLTRPQTLREHKKKFHPNADLTSLHGNNKGKGQSSSASSPFLNESSSLHINPQVSGLPPYDTFFNNNAQELPEAQDIQTDIEMETEPTAEEERGSTNGMLGDLPQQFTTNTNASQGIASLGSSAEMSGQFLMLGGDSSSNKHLYGDFIVNGDNAHSYAYDILNNNQ